MRAAALQPTPILPWSKRQEEEQRFRWVLLATVLLLALFSALMPYLPVEKEEQQFQEVPPRVAQLVLERRQPPPPPPPAEQPEPEPEPVPEPEPEVVEETPPPEPVPAPEPEPEPPAPAPDRTAQARERASSAGVLAFADELADLREVAGDDLAPSAPLSDAGQAATGGPNQRSLITSDVGGASRGINTATLSRNTGGTGLRGRETSRVESPVDQQAAEAAARRREERAQGRRPERTDEEIHLVFDRNKSAFDRLYRRALRSNPTLQGKVVVELTIAPSGEVTAVEVVASDLRDDDLERKIALRVKRLQFPDKDVAVETVRYSIDFVPS